MCGLKPGSASRRSSRPKPSPAGRAAGDGLRTRRERAKDSGLRKTGAYPVEGAIAMDVETAQATRLTEADHAQADQQARVDLAAVYRLLALHGWGDVIFNHAAMRCPSNPRHFLIKRHELLYTEVTASNLVEVSMDDDLDERAGVNRPGFTLHSGVLRGRPDVNCSV